MKCPNCGKEIADDSKFCEYCGTKVESIPAGGKKPSTQGIMSFGEAISTCFNKYITFKGRASRPEFWWFTLFSFLVSLVAEFIDGAMGTFILTMAVYLFMLLPGLSVSVRRCHDSGHSGWWILCPVYNIILMFLPSSEGQNEYD